MYTTEYDQMKSLFEAVIILKSPFGLATLAVYDATWKLECAATIMQLLMALRNASLEYFENQLYGVDKFKC